MPSKKLTKCKKYAEIKFIYDCSDSPMNSLEVLVYLQDPKTE